MLESAVYFTALTWFSVQFFDRIYADNFCVILYQVMQSPWFIILTECFVFTGCKTTRKRFQFFYVELTYFAKSQTASYQKTFKDLQLLSTPSSFFASKWSRELWILWTHCYWLMRNMRARKPDRRHSNISYRHDVTFISVDVESQENLFTIFYMILAKENFV
jgi:hypothetical protein